MPSKQQSAIRDFNPDIIIIASGLDANGFDLLARMQCTSETFREMTRQVMVSLLLSSCPGIALRLKALSSKWHWCNNPQKILICFNAKGWSGRNKLLSNAVKTVDELHAKIGQYVCLFTTVTGLRAPVQPWSSVWIVLLSFSIDKNGVPHAKSKKRTKTGISHKAFNVSS